MVNTYLRCVDAQGATDGTEGIEGMIEWVNTTPGVVLWCA
jgi:hypothetical protein